MSKRYQDMLAEQRRHRVLRILDDSSDYRSNEVLLKGMLNDMGIPTSHDRLRTDLAWLSDQGLVELHHVEDLIIAEITSAGADVAQGHTTVPGVQRRQPRD